MTTSRRPAVRTSIGRIAVSGAAAMATVLAAAPLASADEATTDDPGTTEAPVEPTTPEAPVDETPAEAGAPDTEAPAAEQADEKSPAASAAAADDDPQAAIDDPEPNFGLQKFRVGVRIAEGVDAPAGTSTVGSTITIVITDQDENEETVTCTTEESTVDEEGDDPTASFCVFDDSPLALSDDLPPEARAAVERAEVSDDDFEGGEDEYYFGEPGETYTITQTGAVDGLELDPDVVVIEPCEANFGPFCTTGIFEDEEEKFPLLVTKVVFEDTLPVDEPDPGVDDNNAEDGVLPDTGGSNSALLGYAALMMAGGGWLVARGRRRTSDANIV